MLFMQTYTIAGEPSGRLRVERISQGRIGLEKGGASIHLTDLGRCVDYAMEGDGFHRVQVLGTQMLSRHPYQQTVHESASRIKCRNNESIGRAVTGNGTLLENAC
jgi:hypothetical protein